MKYFYLALLFFAFTNDPFLLAQNKYYEQRSTFNVFNNNGLEVIVTGDEMFKIFMANQDIDLVFDTDVVTADLEGNYSDFKHYEYIDTTGLLVDLRPVQACSYIDGLYAIAGRIETRPWQTDYYSYGYVMLVNEANDSTSFYLLYPEDNFSELWSIAQTPDNQLIIVGGVRTGLGEVTIPYLVRIDAAGNKTLEQTYPFYNSGEYNFFKGVVPTLDGGYVLTGLTNDSAPDPEDANMILMKIDNNGNFEAINTVDFGWREEPVDMIATSDGGVAIGIQRGESQYPPISDYEGEGMLLKYSDGLELEWGIEVFNDAPVTSVVQLVEDTYVVCGSHVFEETGMVDLSIAKIRTTNLEPEILWQRFYGGSWADYAYDLTASPDGGFIAVGRSDSLSVDTAYMYTVKTNCMGLLTEPQVHFDYVQEGLTVELTNLSQHIYPDSIDGGHFIWDFGDGTISNDIHPTHTYVGDGSYEIQLTAVVCNDTAVYTQMIDFVTGVDVTDFTDAIHVHPNPSSEILFIERSTANKNAPLLVELYDVTGKRQQYTLLNPHEKVIHIGDLGKGLYVCIISSLQGEILTRQKIVKE